MLGSLVTKALCNPHMLGSLVTKALCNLHMFGYIDYAGFGKPPFNTTAPFNRTYDIEEAKGHFLKKKAKDADSVFSDDAKRPERQKSHRL
jgi:hypothetical protein